MAKNISLGLEIFYEKKKNKAINFHIFIYDLLIIATKNPLISPIIIIIIIL